MKRRIARQSEAFRVALEYCHIYGLNWKLHILPKVENKEITAYHILDETGSTTVSTVKI